MKDLRMVSALLAVGLLLGCATLNRSVVTMDKIVNNAIQTWTKMVYDGKSTPEINRKVVAVHERYKQAAGVLEVAYNQYLQTGDQSAYLQALTVARVTVGELLDLLWPAEPATINALRVDLQTAIK